MNEIQSLYYWLIAYCKQYQDDTLWPTAAEFERDREAAAEAQFFAHDVAGREGP